MLTVKQVSERTGVSVRTLHHYHKIGLLCPSEISQAVYRLYDDDALERLQIILLFRALDFPLKDIANILNRPDFDRNEALTKQVELFQMRIEHLNNLITLANGLKAIGVRHLDFTDFDVKKIDEYERKARERYGKSAEWKEYEAKRASRTDEQDRLLSAEWMNRIAEFGALRDLPAEDERVQERIRALRAYITEHMYTCSVVTLRALGRMYAGGGEMTQYIDRVGGEGTAEAMYRAIEVYAASTVE